MALFALLALARVWRGHRAGVLGGLVAALLLVVAFCGVLAPWTVRNYMALDRFVPVTTGGGKALFVATYLPGDGRQQLVKRQLIARYYGKKDLPYVQVRDDGRWSRPAQPGREASTRSSARDAALARIGRENFRSTRASSRSTTRGW